MVGAVGDEGHRDRSVGYLIVTWVLTKVNGSTKSYGGGGGRTPLVSTAGVKSREDGCKIIKK
jgi:hypothetical protein